MCMLCMYVCVFMCLYVFLCTCVSVLVTVHMISVFYKYFNGVTDTLEIHDHR